MNTSLRSFLRTAAVKVDALPCSPQRVGSRLVGHHSDRRIERAQEDPTWSTIQARRKTRNGGVILRGDDLDASDWATQMQIEEELTPDPWWLEGAYLLSTASFHRGVGIALNAYDRVRKGWGDLDANELGYNEPTRIGQMLLAQTGGIREGDETNENLEVEAPLVYHGIVLTTRWESSKEQDAARDEYTRLDEDPTSNPEDVEAAYEHYDAIRSKDREAVKASLHWFADNHERMFN